MDNNRIYKWDNIKFFLILFVVVGHFTESLVEASHLYKSIWIFIYSFHMPFFIFISGYFHRNKNIKNKVSFYLILYLVSNVLIYLENRILYGKANFSLWGTNSMPWFMLSMASFILITYLFENTNPVLLLIISLVAGLSAGYDKSLGDQFALLRTFTFYPFYIGGFIFSKYYPSFEKKNKLPLKIISTLIILGYLVLAFIKTSGIYKFRKLFTGRNLYEKVPINLEGALLRLITYAISTILIFAIISIVPDMNIKFVTKAGSKTLQVYFWHIFIKNFVIFFITKEVVSTWSKPLVVLYLILPVVVTIILTLPPFKYPTAIFQKLTSRTINSK